MENLRGMFSLGGGGRANEITQGSRTDGTNWGGGRANDNTQGGRTDGTNSPTRARRSSFGSEDQWDDTGVPFRDDTSAPSVNARLRPQGDQPPGDNAFSLGGGGDVNSSTHQGQGWRQRQLHHRRKSSSGTRSAMGARRHKPTHLIPGLTLPPMLRVPQGWQGPHKRGDWETPRRSHKNSPGNGRWEGTQRK